jgi:hypothetical protein
MDQWTSGTLSVAGYDIVCKVKPGRVHIRVSRDGFETGFQIEGPREAWPPREQVERMAMNVWEAADDLRRFNTGRVEHGD